MKLVFRWVQRSFLVGLIGLSAWAIWLRWPKTRMEPAYVVLFDDTQGIQSATELFFHGVPIGNVETVKLYTQLPESLRARVDRWLGQLPSAQDDGGGALDRGIPILVEIGVDAMKISPRTPMHANIGQAPFTGRPIIDLETDREAVLSDEEGPPFILGEGSMTVEDLKKKVDGAKRLAASVREWWIERNGAKQIDDVAQGTENLAKKLKSVREWMTTPEGGKHPLDEWSEGLASVAEKMPRTGGPAEPPNGWPGVRRFQETKLPGLIESLGKLANNARGAWKIRERSVRDRLEELQASLERTLEGMRRQKASIAGFLEWAEHQEKGAAGDLLSGEDGK